MFGNRTNRERFGFFPHSRSHRHRGLFGQNAPSGSRDDASDRSEDGRGGFREGFGRRGGRHDGATRGGFGRGRFGRGGGTRDWGGDDITRGRKLSAEELQLVILALLAEAPAHGYELIRRLEERSGGFYKPSPGVIYPSLTYLEEAGLTAVTPDGARKLYTLTAEGEARHVASQDEAQRILELLSRIGARMSEVRDALSGVGDLDPTLGQDFHDARLALKMALKSRRGAGPEELRRVVQILRRAAAEITGD